MSKPKSRDSGPEETHDSWPYFEMMFIKDQFTTRDNLPNLSIEQDETDDIVFFGDDDLADVDNVESPHEAINSQSTTTSDTISLASLASTPVNYTRVNYSP